MYGRVFRSANSNMLSQYSREQRELPWQPNLGKNKPKLHWFQVCTRYRDTFCMQGVVQLFLAFVPSCLGNFPESPCTYTYLSTCVILNLLCWNSAGCWRCTCLAAPVDITSSCVWLYIYTDTYTSFPSIHCTLKNYHIFTNISMNIPWMYCVAVANVFTVLHVCVCVFVASLCSWQTCTQQSRCMITSFQ